MKKLKLHLPDGYEIRKAQKNDAKEIALVHLATYTACYQGIIEQNYLESLTYEKLLDLRVKILSENLGIYLVATYKDKIIAFYDAGSFRFHKNQKVSRDQLKHRKEKGEVYAIYVLQEHQHIGIGKVLFQAGKKALIEKELIPFIAWVLKDNHKAIFFYEKMSGKLVDELTVTIGERPYQEIAYRFEE